MYAIDAGFDANGCFVEIVIESGPLLLIGGIVSDPEYDRTENGTTCEAFDGLTITVVESGALGAVP